MWHDLYDKKNLLWVDMRTSEGFVVIFDVCNRRSFERVERRLRYIERHGHIYTHVVVIGTKCDCVKKRCVERREVEALIAGFTDSKIKYFETSAKDPHVSTSMKTIMENLTADLFFSRYRRVNNLMDAQPEVPKRQSDDGYEIREAQAKLLKSRNSGCCVVS